MPISRRSFLRLGLWTTGAGSLMTTSGLLYASKIEPYSLEITYREFRLKSLPDAFDGYTLVQISDLHLGGFVMPEFVLDVMTQANALQADMIVLTGDYVSGQTVTITKLVEETVRTLTAPDGVYAILGNHDHWLDGRAVSQAIRDAGIRLLLNEHIVLRREDASFYLAGVDDIWEGLQDLDAALADIPAEACVILLAHEPDYADTVAQDGRVALQLSGHSHGGQVRLPFKGAIQLPHLARKYDLGIYQIGDLQLFVNRGIGMSSIPMRLGASPELTHITLRKG